MELQADRGDRLLLLRPRCPLSEAEAGRALDETLPRLRDIGESPGSYRTIFIGRLVDYPWLSEGLARAAVRSGRWDFQRGRPRDEALHRFVVRVLSDRGLLGALADALDRQGLSVVGVSAEKVLVVPVSELPFGRRLEGEGVPHRGRLPYDAMVHLLLAPLGESR